MVFFVRHVFGFGFRFVPAVRSYSITHPPCLPSCLLVLAPSEAKPSILRGGIVVLTLLYLYHRAYFAWHGSLTLYLSFLRIPAHNFVISKFTYKIMKGKINLAKRNRKHSEEAKRVGKEKRWQRG